MKEIRLSIIQNDEDPGKDKRVDVHIINADAVLSRIAGKQDHPFQGPAAQLFNLVNSVLANCDDTDKIEIGVDQEGKPNPASAFVAKGDGSGNKALTL
jgi:hypothetical protein